MKTTIEISDALFERARRLARAQHKTLRAVVEESLRRTLQAHDEPPTLERFHMPAFGAGGRRDEFADAGWGKTRDTVYRDPPVNEQ